MTCN
jgi:hypothetical protein